MDILKYTWYYSRNWLEGKWSKHECVDAGELKFGGWKY